MSTERDELRGTLSNTVCNVSFYSERVQSHLLGSDMSRVLDKTADALLAAGYRKPQQVTTAEELEALPVGSVVMAFNSDGDQLVSLKDFDGQWEQAGTSDGWQPKGIIENYTSATVLHVGSVEA